MCQMSDIVGHSHAQDNACVKFITADATITKKRHNQPVRPVSSAKSNVHKSLQPTKYILLPNAS